MDEGNVMQRLRAVDDMLPIVGYAGPTLKLLKRNGTALPLVLSKIGFTAVAQNLFARCVA